MRGRRSIVEVVTFNDPLEINDVASSSYYGMGSPNETI